MVSSNLNDCMILFLQHSRGIVNTSIRTPTVPATLLRALSLNCTETCIPGEHASRAHVAAVATHAFASAPEAPHRRASNRRAHANPVCGPELPPDPRVHRQPPQNALLSQEPGLDA